MNDDTMWTPHDPGDEHQPSLQIACAAHALQMAALAFADRGPPALPELERAALAHAVATLDTASRRTR